MYSTEGYHALRSTAAIVRRGDRGVLAVEGSDRLPWLQGLLTNDVATLETGESRYAAYLTPQGRMISDMRVINLEARTLLEVPGALAEQLRARLDALLFAEDARITDVSNSLAVVDLHGPEAPAIAARTRSALASLISIAAIRDDVYGVPGVTLFAPRADVETLVRSLVEGGAIETSLETLDVVRIEAGQPLFLVDMDEHTIPLEAGIEDRAISFTKGCYVGQEVIVRVMHRGQGRVAKRLAGFLFEKQATPKAADGVRSGEREIGRITSVVRSPALERPIALGYLHRDFVEPGTIVEVATAAGAATATVTRLPFVEARVTESRETHSGEGTHVKEST